MTANVKIRRFCIEDYDALIALWDEAQLPCKPEGRDRRDKIEEGISRSNTVFLLAEADDKMVGSVFGTHDGRKGWINRLAVSPACRRQGLGIRLIKEAEKRLEDMGIRIIACLIEDKNTPSLAIFEGLGYKRHADIVYLTKRKSPVI